MKNHATAAQAFTGTSLPRRDTVGKSPRILTMTAVPQPHYTSCPIVDIVIGHHGIVQIIDFTVAAFSGDLIIAAGSHIRMPEQRSEAARLNARCSNIYNQALVCISRCTGSRIRAVALLLRARTQWLLPAVESLPDPWRNTKRQFCIQCHDPPTSQAYESLNFLIIKARSNTTDETAISEKTTRIPRLRESKVHARIPRG